MTDGRRPRLDQALVEAGIAPTRTRAQALVAAGVVTVDGAPAARPGARVAPGARLAVTGDPLPWVSRGALKLLHALDAFGLSPAGAVALDLGASTGGFTEVLLARGASEVWAVDVGHGQLAPALRADPRVHAIEGQNVRDLRPGDVPAPGWITADLSFISLAKAIGPALALAGPGATLVALVKPQFEVGPAHVGRGGIVRDPAAAEAAAAAVRDFVAGAGWTVLGEIPSPILGGDGNAERLLAARRD
ncbi:TlyA family RNA methyltransferase [Amaricoccus sp.]|uniref:TlyA family RNA methyltransferase n=1 Tax=Amaricoccus sp. TaxID=1872485 RepID=UPI001B463EBD|nr:TlyA family RNA methyltransferase [Amaricoccus sp.]MBP7241041.1 TlyA family RNA methyltransferase [Amaricoccus sp.]